MNIKYEEGKLTLEPDDTDPRDEWFLESLGVYKNRKVHAYVRTAPGRYRDKTVIEITEWVPRDPDAPKPATGQGYRRPPPPLPRREAP